MVAVGQAGDEILPDFSIWHTSSQMCLNVLGSWCGYSGGRRGPATDREQLHEQAARRFFRLLSVAYDVATCAVNDRLGYEFDLD